MATRGAFGTSVIEADAPDTGTYGGKPLDVADTGAKAAGAAAESGTVVAQDKAAEPETVTVTTPTVAAVPLLGAASSVPPQADASKKSPAPDQVEAATKADAVPPVDKGTKPDKPVEPDASTAADPGKTATVPSQAGAAPSETAAPGKTGAGKTGDLAGTKTDIPAIDGAEKPAQDAEKPADDAPAVAASYGLARLTRRRLRPATTARHAVVPLSPLLRRYPAVHGMAQRSLDGAAAWRRGRWGRLTLPGLLLLALLSAGGATGGLLVPAIAGTQARSQPSTDPSPGVADTNAPAPSTDVPIPPLVTDVPLVPIDPTAGATPTAPAAGARPADALASWAQQAGAKAGIPPVAMQAYGYAEWVVGRRQPNCHLNWTTLAAIGRVESNHGRANGAALLPDGESNPPIYGLPLDGQGDRKLIPDTDQGRLDGDTTFDRAVGSMQFIPTTWAIWKVDADNDGVTDPNDIDDAALAAGNYLCANGKDLATTEDWWNAILTYNNVEPYAQSVYEAANDFGVRSRT